MVADVRFERENRDGIIPVGTYLIDAAGRLGIEIDDECGRRGECDQCAVKITKGADLLSEPTKSEIEQLSEKRRKDGERLACQAKFEKSGEVVIMTKEKVVEDEKPEAEAKTDEFRKEFEKMPLDQKVSSLLELEMIALGETVSYIFNSPYEVAGKVMDVMARYGRKLEDEVKKATRPDEHVPEPENKNGSARSERSEKKNSVKSDSATKEKKATSKKDSAKKSSVKKSAKKSDKSSDSK